MKMEGDEYQRIGMRRKRKEGEGIIDQVGKEDGGGVKTEGKGSQRIGVRRRRKKEGRRRDHTESRKWRSKENGRRRISNNRDEKEEEGRRKEKDH